MLLRIALASLANRRASALLCVFSIALAVSLLLGVERLRQEARHSFTQTISGTDLIVGARAGSVNLLLYSVFRLGHATHNIHYQSYQHIAQHPQVRWAIPLSLGDSHRGYPVLGTNSTYFEHYRYAQQQPLQLAQGRAFAEDPFELVLGAEVAAALGYRLDQQLVLAHGTAQVSLLKHDDKPFRVVGILARTGTPVDRTLHISLAGMQALHLDWQQGVPARGNARISAKQARQMDLQPQQLTAVAVGLERRIATFALQRELNQYPHEPLLAIMPGVALQELWQLMGTAESALRMISAVVVAVGLLGMLTVILSSLNQRRREMALLRAVGARPWHIAGLLMAEASGLALAGALAGLALLYLGLGLLQAPIQAHYGIDLRLGWPASHEWQLLGWCMLAAATLGLVPAWAAYRQSLADGLNPSH